MLKYRRSRNIAAAALLGLLLTAPLGAQTSATAPNAVVHIDNFGRVSANYYRGAQPKGSDYSDLKALGIKTIIDLTQGGDAAEPGIVRGLGMKFFRIPMTTHEAPTPAKLQQFLTLVNDSANQPVYVHCQGGRHRTGIMTAVYRMTGDGWTADRAFAEMKQYKFGADFLHPEFKSFVYDYHPDVATLAATAVDANRTK
jgi:tyrosine-protein phosphatase SIW14